MAGDCITPVSFETAVFVAIHMRESDRREVYAARWNEDPVELAATCMAVPDFTWICWRRGVPAAIVGGIPIHPNVWSVYSFGTPDWPEVVLPLTRHVRRVMIPRLLKSGMIRSECRSIATHTEAHSWLEVLGAKKESTLSAFGKNGEDFFLFRWLRDELHVRSNAGWRGWRRELARTRL